MSESIRRSTKDGLLTVRLSRPHGNAINLELVEALIAVCDEAEADPGVRGVLLAASGKIFCPGLDLQELSRLDRPEMKHFLRRFNAGILRLFSFFKPLVAAIHGHAVAGGCVLSLTADWRILGRGALIGLNEVRVGVPFPFGVTVLMSEAIDASRREEVALFGRNYKDDEAVAAGLAHELADAEGFDGYCLARLGELAEKDPRAFSLTKRYLRSAAMERMRAATDGHDEEFLGSWFSEPTQRRIAGIVRDLEARGG